MRARTLIGLLLLLAGAAFWLAPSAGATQVAAPINPAVQISWMSCPQAGYCTAVGGYADGLSRGQGLLLTQRRSSWRVAVQAPLPVDAAFDPLNPAKNTGLTGVSCVAAGECTAVGVYTDRANEDRGVMLTEHHSHWQRGDAAGLPGNAQRPRKGHRATADNMVLLSVGCVSVGNCYAVGNYVTDANTLQGLIVTEHDGHWRTGRPAPLPAGATVRGQQAVLYTITCVRGGGCLAAGSYKDLNGAQQGLLLSEHSGVWQVAGAAHPPTGAGSDPHVTPITLACVATGSCAVAGDYQDGRNNSLGLLLSTSSGVWTPATAATLPANAAPPTSYNAQTTVLGALSCAALGDCAAVGSYTDNEGNTQALLLDEAAGSWQAGHEVHLPSNAVTGATHQTAGLDAVSCPAAGTCLAGGFYTDTAQSDDSLLVSETGGSWSAGSEVRLPRGAGHTQYSAVDGLNCNGVGNCTVIGTYNDHHGDTLAYAISQSKGAFGHATALPVPAASPAEIKLSIEDLVRPLGPHTSLAAIRKAHAFQLPYVLLEPGRLSVTWYARAGHGRILVAAGEAHGKQAIRGQLKLRLTRAGRALFGHDRALALSASAVLNPHGKRAIAASGSFTLR